MLLTPRCGFGELNLSNKAVTRVSYVVKRKISPMLKEKRLTSQPRESPWQGRLKDELQSDSGLRKRSHVAVNLDFKVDS